MPIPAVQQAIRPSPYSPPRVKRDRLSIDDRLRVLWYLSKGEGGTRIAQHMEISPNTVYEYRKRVFANPYEMLDLPSVYRRRDKGDYQCGFCSHVEKHLRKMQRHVLAHVLVYERARDLNLDRPRPPRL